MHTTVLAWICLMFASCTYKAQSTRTKEDVQGVLKAARHAPACQSDDPGRLAKPLTPFATLLLMLSPAASFHTSSPANPLHAHACPAVLATPTVVLSGRGRSGSTKSSESSDTPVQQDQPSNAEPQRGRKLWCCSHQQAMPLSRQAALRAAAAAFAFQWPFCPFQQIAHASSDYAEVPLGLCGGAYCITYSVDDQLFRAVVDTGSPFLIVDGTCPPGNQGRFGCYYGNARASGLEDSGLSFGGQDVGVQWRRGSFALTLEPIPAGGTMGEALAIKDAVFGVVCSYQNKGGSGSIYIGFTKRRGPRVRQPTFLEQTDVVSMRFNFLQRSMLLSRVPLIDRKADAVPILDLRPLAPDLKYACLVSRMVVNGQVVQLGAPTVAIIDTGTTGLAMSEELYNSGRMPLPMRLARIELQTERGNLCAMEASVRKKRKPSKGIPQLDIDLKAPEFDEFPFIVSPLPIRWGSGRAGEPYVLFVGLAFYWQRQVTIDADNKRLTIV